MKTKNSLSYLRSYRLRWGLSQGELAYLLGWRTEGIISRLEKKKRPPSAKMLIGCYILFGTRAAELFPGLFNGVEADVMKRVWELYEQIQGNPSERTKAKIQLLEDAIDRAAARKREKQV
jgi:transcriptional regulator with XRE-family HTH domain